MDFSDFISLLALFISGSSVFLSCIALYLQHAKSKLIVNIGLAKITNQQGTYFEIVYQATNYGDKPVTIKLLGGDNPPRKILWMHINTSDGFILIPSSGPPIPLTLQPSETAIWRFNPHGIKLNLSKHLDFYVMDTFNRRWKADKKSKQQTVQFLKELENNSQSS